MAITAGYIFTAGEAILAKKLNLAFSSAGAFTGTFDGTVGATTPNTGAFTTLSASSTVSGAGFSTYLASPPAIGGTVAAAANFTTLGATGLVTFDLGTGALPTLVSAVNTVMRFGNVDAQGVTLEADNFGVNQAAINIIGRSAGGTRASPSATPLNFILYRLSAYGFDTALTTTQSAFYQVQAGSLWAAGNRETKHVWQGTPSGSPTGATWITMDGTGFACALSASFGAAGISASTFLNLPLSSTSQSSLRLAHGAAPSAPVNGDIWTTTAGIFVRINGATVGPLS